MEGSKGNIDALIESLRITDSQTIIEQDEIQLIDCFIKEHASKYNLAKNCEDAKLRQSYIMLTSTIVDNRLKLELGGQGAAPRNKFSS